MTEFREKGCHLLENAHFATDAASPATSTWLSLPLYLSGRPVNSIDESTIFHDAARLGAPSELVGFYLPYCRYSFAALLERCTWQPFTWGGVFDGPVGIGASLVRQLLAMVVVGNRRAHIARIEQSSEAGVRALSDSSLRLVFLHLPIPHLPPVWDARRGRYTFTQVRLNGYFDNLVLSDRILARLRTAIDRGGTAQPTFLIVTSDHPWRSQPIDGHVGGKIPFFVRTPSAINIEIPSHVDAVRLRALATLLLAGRLTSARDVASWLASPPAN